VLHSPLSPLTPSSPLYPDGIVTPLWITKHQSRLPSAFIAFVSLTADATTSSLHDNKLKSEISNARSVLAAANYKTRLIVVLLGEGLVSPADLEDRLSNIRRSTGLDGKTLYFLPHNSSQIELTEFVRSLVSSLRSICVEYYRDLSKHARRKRNRSVIPQPTIPPGTTGVLPLPGWNVRYEFKLGVFAEFRQEMEAACRNYETAYDNLLSIEMIESITVWSPRFNEARMLADVIAIRIIRCLLWADQGTAAVRTWCSHRDRMQDLVDRRARGTDNYGWEAWQSTWARTMADLISRSQYPPLHARSPQSRDVVPIFVGPEKSLPVGDRVAPWEHLHHEGYWLNQAQRHTQHRRKRAQQMPEEDRQSPEKSPASVIARKARLYDTYLTLEPYAEFPADGSVGYDYVAEIVSTLNDAIELFAQRGQSRMVEMLKLQMALEYVQGESWSDAVSILRSLWTSRLWRKAGWWKLLQPVGWALLRCMAHVRDAPLMIQLTWELSRNIFDKNADFHYDLRSSLAELGLEEPAPAIAIDTSETLSPIMAAFTFSSSDGHVGEVLQCQLFLRSEAQPGSPALTLTEVKIAFEGGLRPIYLVDAPERDNAPDLSVQFVRVRLQDSGSVSAGGDKRSSAGAIAALTGQADLTLRPGQERVYNMEFAPREAGEASVAAITLIINDEKFSLTVTTSDFDEFEARWWESRRGIPVPRAIGQERNAYVVTVLPKPPKMHIEVSGLRKSYYTNEEIELGFHIINKEEESAVAVVEARLISPAEHAAKMRWAASLDPDNGAVGSDAGVQTLPQRQLGNIPPSEEVTVSLHITDTVAAVDHELELTVTYRLNSDPETLLTKAVTVDVGVIRPFEANYDFLPRLDAEPWPNFFAFPPPDTDAPRAVGLKHRYLVTANLYSFTSEPVIIEAILLTSKKVLGGATCSTTTGVLKDTDVVGHANRPDNISTEIQPEQMRGFNFDLAVQKLVLGDRHSVAVDLVLEIGWRRLDSDKVNTTVLEVPRLMAPMAEPRVLLTVSNASLDALRQGICVLSFTIENPSMHFLTFNIAMDSSDDFAFSGPKVCGVSLVPMSRHAVEYRILPNKTEEWVKVQLSVVDAYFAQTLKVLPGDDRVKRDKDGNTLVWVG